jgi:Rad3-related DNA helicase
METMNVESKIYNEDDLYTTFKSFKLFSKDGFEPRPFQLKAAQFALNSKKPIVMIKAPMGSGKSAIGMTCLHSLPYGGIYLVNTKSLQMQITNDYPEARSLFGRSNYKCINKAGYDENTGEYISVADCPFREPKPPKEIYLDVIEARTDRSDDEEKTRTENYCVDYNDCVYRIKKAEVISWPIKILNYPYYLTECNYARGSFRGSELVICDEADTIEDTLLGFIKIEMSGYTIGRYGLTLPRYKTVSAKSGLDSWKDWAYKSIRKMDSFIKGLRQDEPRKIYEEATGMRERLKSFVSYVDNTWLFGESETRFGKKWTFVPTWITQDMMDNYLLAHGQKFVLMSATFKPIPIMCLELGMREEDIDFFEIPSTFNPDKRPIYINTIAKVSKNTIDEESGKITDRIKEILEKHKNDKGLIHTSNYKLADIIMSIGDERLVTHNSSNRISVLDEFKASDKPLVLVSPSMERGVSLDDDLARFVVVAKAPFPYLGDSQVSARLYGYGSAGEFWYRATTAQTLEQQTGRGVRSERDYCKVYIIDHLAKELITKHPTMFTDHFRECLRWMED